MMYNPNSSWSMECLYYTYGSTANFWTIGPRCLYFISKKRRCNVRRRIFQLIPYMYMYIHVLVSATPPQVHSTALPDLPHTVGHKDGPGIGLGLVSRAHTLWPLDGWLLLMHGATCTCVDLALLLSALVQGSGWSIYSRDVVCIIRTCTWCHP